MASLGLFEGVAQVMGVKLRGWPAWFMHRTYHMAKIPTFNRKARVVLDWTAALFFRRDLVSLGRLHDPRQAFEEAARDDAPARTKPATTRAKPPTKRAAKKPST